MQISVTFRHVDPSNSLKDYVTEKMEKLSRYFDKPIEAKAVLSVEKHLHLTDINVSADGVFIRATESSTDMYSAIDKALSKLERQVKRNKEKQKRHKPMSSGEQILESQMKQKDRPNYNENADELIESDFEENEDANSF